MKGVMKTKSGTFRAMFYHKRRQYYLGVFHSEREAREALAAEAAIAACGAYPPEVVIGPQTAYEAFGEYLAYDPATGGFSHRRIPQGATSRTVGYMTDRGYVNVRFRDKSYRGHRVAWLLMTGEWPKLHIDHINGDRADNRWANLRLATPAQNQWNKRQDRTSKSPYKGVHLDQRGNWRAKISKGKRQIHLGKFDSPEAARLAYIAAAKEYFGEYANPG